MLIKTGGNIEDSYYLQRQLRTLKYSLEDMRVCSCYDYSVFPNSRDLYHGAIVQAALSKGGKSFLFPIWWIRSTGVVIGHEFFILRFNTIWMCPWAKCHGAKESIKWRRMGLQKFMQTSELHGERRVTPFISTLATLSAVLVPKCLIVSCDSPLVGQKHDAKQRPYCSQVWFQLTASCWKLPHIIRL